MSEKGAASVEFDTSDVDRWVGVPLGVANARYPVNELDIARWAQAMHNPNPLHFDPDYGAASRFGRIVGPFSFSVACGDGHGAKPSIQGHVEGTHMLTQPGIITANRVRVPTAPHPFRCADRCRRVGAVAVFGSAGADRFECR